MNFVDPKEYSYPGLVRKNRYKTILPSEWLSLSPNLLVFYLSPSLTSSRSPSHFPTFLFRLFHHIPHSCLSLYPSSLYPSSLYPSSLYPSSLYPSSLYPSSALPLPPALIRVFLPPLQTLTAG